MISFITKLLLLISLIYLLFVYIKLLLKTLVLTTYFHNEDINRIWLKQFRRKILQNILSRNISCIHCNKFEVSVLTPFELQTPFQSGSGSPEPRSVRETLTLKERKKEKKTDLDCLGQQDIISTAMETV